MKRLKDNNPYSIRVIERTINLLECFLYQPNEYTMADVAKLTNLPITTVFRIIQTLQKHNFLAYDALSNRYSLGIKLFELGESVPPISYFRKVASRHLDLLLT